MQGIADTPQGAARSVRLLGFGGGNHAALNQRGECRRGEYAPPQPQDQLQRAQTARTVLEVRFEVVGGVVETRTALFFLATLGREETLRWPQSRVVHELRERALQPLGAVDQARIEQAGINYP